MPEVTVASKYLYPLVMAAFSKAVWSIRRASTVLAALAFLSVHKSLAQTEDSARTNFSLLRVQLRLNDGFLAAARGSESSQLFPSNELATARIDPKKLEAEALDKGDKALRALGPVYYLAWADPKKVVPKPSLTNFPKDISLKQVRTLSTNWSAAQQIFDQWRAAENGTNLLRKIIGVYRDFIWGEESPFMSKVGLPDWLEWDDQSRTTVASFKDGNLWFWVRRFTSDDFTQGLKTA